MYRGTPSRRYGNYNDRHGILGHILREGQDKITFKAVEEQSLMGLPGNLLMDAPPHVTIRELAIKAKDRGYWKSLANLIP